MIQFVAAAAIGAVGLYAYSSFKKHWAEIKRKEELEKAKKPKTLGDLEQDPVTGRYRLKDDDSDSTQN